MKIFYAVQATGNGHVSRAKTILPYLSKYGEVSVFLSGNNCSLQTALPVEYRSKGISFQYDQSGGVDMLGTARSMHLRKTWKEAKQLPIEKYDLIINDFEAITSLACRIKKIPSIHFGHQASFVSPLTPRPEKKNRIGEWVMNNYAKGTDTIGLHFKNYDKHIYQPIIKNSILQSSPKDHGHITVYLGHYSDEVLIKEFKQLKKFQFQLFSAYTKTSYVVENIQVYPVNQELFNQSLINCHGIITGAGFETPSEALYLEKKVLVVPMKGQYEQACNAAALSAFGVLSIPAIDNYFASYFNKWIFDLTIKPLELTQTTEEIVGKVMEHQAIYNEMDVNICPTRLNYNNPVLVTY
jgi:uncharacterized protein (TIGR00661 family)